MSVEFTSGLIDPHNVERVINLERQELTRMGLDEEQLESSVPDTLKLERNMIQRPGTYLGVYAASELVGFANTGKWTPNEDVPFAKTSLEKGLLHASDTLGRLILNYPMGIFRIAIDQEKDDIFKYRATYELLRSLSRLADENRSSILMTVYNPGDNPIVQPLIYWDFKDTGQHIGPRDGREVRSAKYIRPKKNYSRGKTIQDPFFSPEPNISK
jgi:hypothetical protein